MQLTCLDFETLFADRNPLDSGRYTITTTSTEGYIRDPRFEVHGASIKFGTEPTCWYDRHVLPQVLNQINWANVMLLTHHSQFDAAILAWHYGIVPAYYLDTLAMGSLLFGPTQSVGLGKLAKKFGLAEKNVPYALFDGKHWDELTPDVQRLVAEGCNHDVELTYTIFQKMCRGDY
jgi:hypothetical protein